MLHQLAYDYRYQHYNAPTSDGSPNAVSTAVLIILGLLLLALVVLFIVGLWKTFVKAGRPGWAAIVPVYNSWVIFEIAGRPGWWGLVGLLVIIPLIGPFAGIAALVLTVIAMLELAQHFGKSSLFAVLGLVIFSAIGFIILGFGKAVYEPERTLTGGGVEFSEAPVANPRQAKQSKKTNS